MKILLFSTLILISTFISERPDCDSIQLDLTVINTTEGENNGRIEVAVQKGKAPFKVFLFADKRADNLSDVKFKDLKDLKPGNYVLVVQDRSGDCTYSKNIKIN